MTQVAPTASIEPYPTHREAREIVARSATWRTLSALSADSVSEGLPHRPTTTQGVGGHNTGRAPRDNHQSADATDQELAVSGSDRWSTRWLTTWEEPPGAIVTP